MMFGKSPFAVNFGLHILLVMDFRLDESCFKKYDFTIVSFWSN